MLLPSLRDLLPLALVAPSTYPPAVPAELYSPLIGKKLLATAELTPGVPTQYPQFTTQEGNWTFLPVDTFSNGFVGASYYLMHERAHLCPKSLGGVPAAKWLELGRSSSTGIIPLENHTTVGHAVGFLAYPFVDELQINPGNETALHAVLKFGKVLADRFNPKVGCVRSWDNTTDPTDFEVIVDSVSTLEHLFVTSEITCNDTLIDIAISHADTVMKNHIRPDGSSFHLLDYNSTTGKIIDKRTTEGYAPNSTWTRGHAFGMYGFANVYRRAGLKRHLDTARRMATYFVNHVPASGIVPWDFNAPDKPFKPADSAAATVAVKGLLLLAQQELSLKPANKSGAAFYNNAALNILSDTTKAFWKPEWQSLLSNASVNFVANPPNYDTGLIYGDYFFLSLGNDLLKYGMAKC
ncbi:glycoside hydrolase family 88 protein [Auriscalpium vulgare]|uniref:Glycoside hydrolase family 88 protein n=1 Tax=Auriscalpium vulgare TaxID=40419 RepID=A0ACB8S9T7_9AGAM|nr:glycoside hydrolase family 88 protein [Auriscalpium vulgare]